MEYKMLSLSFKTKQNKNNQLIAYKHLLTNKHK